MRRCGHAECEAQKSHDLGLQVSLIRGDNEVPVSRVGGDVGQRARELLRETARAHEIIIHAGAINRDHVHMLIGIPPHLSVSRAVQYLKGRSSHKLLSEYQSLRKRYWGQHLWGRGYWVATSGNVTDEVWKQYIEDQKPENSRRQLQSRLASVASRPLGPTKSGFKPYAEATAFQAVVVHSRPLSSSSERLARKIWPRRVERPEST